MSLDVGHSSSDEEYDDFDFEETEGYSDTSEDTVIHNKEDEPAAVSNQVQEISLLPRAELLEKKEIDEFTCPICFQVLQEPRLLPCNHMFCTSCLKSFVEKQISTWVSRKSPGHRAKRVKSIVEDPKASMPACPVCRVQFQVPDLGVTAFPTFLGDRTHHQLDGKGVDIAGEENDSEMKCNSSLCCNVATVFCKSGCGFLCGQCIEPHQRLKGTKYHLVIDTQKLKEQSQPTGDITKCKHHPNSVIEYYCNTCFQDPLVCVRCIPERHNQHAYVPLEEGYTNLRQSLESNLRTASEIIQSMNISFDKLIEHNEKIEDTSEGAIKVVKDTVQKFTNVLNMMEVQMIDEVRSKQNQLVSDVQQKLVEVKDIIANLQLGKKRTEEILYSDRPSLILKHGSIVRCLFDTALNRGSSLGPHQQYVLKFLPFNSITIRKDIATTKGVQALGRILMQLDLPQNSQKFNRHIDSIKELQAKVGNRGTGKLEFDHAWGISVHPKTGNIYIADQFNHRIQVVSPSFEFVSQFGHRGGNDGEFNNPISVTVSPNGDRVVVVDNGNHRLQVFGADGTFIIAIAAGESQRITFRNPLNVAISSGGLIYVADTRTERVQILCEDGSLVGIMGEKGCGDGEVGPAEGIAITDEDEVCVLARGGAKIQMYDLMGEFKRSVMIDRVESRCSLVVGPNRTFWVSDSDNHRIVVYSYDGDKIKTLGGPGVGDGEFNNQMGIAFGPEGNFYVCDYGNSRIQRF
eukprot:TRINITY_DN15826_c0_g1_i1.p1 TRINITY_DN15826_c0_g1~~TRINITY_DN15826_c0_g1_i1.p1  ORF type:complete len:743 (+),score=130.39 TRINITY_DN15826_c0_g1_i1:62-2290(+)